MQKYCTVYTGSVSPVPQQKLKALTI